LSIDLLAWLNLAIRWLHVIAGIAWIGASFYFVWLDNNLRPSKTGAKGVHGELWAVHGGGFYHSQKYLVSPGEMPETLHWFKWEAYTTWLSGTALLAVLYWAQASVYLIDKAKAPMTPAEAVLLGMACIAGGWMAYDVLCKALGSRPRLFAIAWFAALTAAAWGLTRVFSDRGAFIHVGAIIGTAMVGNVLFVIIPNQRKVVADIAAGRAPDPALGKQGKQRSVHNNYMTLPVVFIMISNHYPLVTGHPLNWLLLAIISLAGVSIRHFFNLKHVGRIRYDFLAYGAALFVVVAGIASSDLGRPKPPPAGTVTFTDIQPLVKKHCITCHSAHPTHDGFSAPPNGVVYDAPADLRKYAARIKERAVLTTSMPLGNETGMTAEERARLGAWIDQGAKVP
jgi:uncharacterized membrane protein